MRIYTLEEFDRDMKRLSGMVKASDAWRHIQNLYGVPRGGVAIALWMSHLLDKPIITKRNQIGLSTLVVDDISDRGFTLSEIRPHMSLTIFYNPDSSFEPTFWLHEKKDDWIQFPWETEATTRTKKQEKQNGP